MAFSLRPFGTAPAAATLPPPAAAAAAAASAASSLLLGTAPAALGTIGLDIFLLGRTGLLLRSLLRTLPGIAPIHQSSPGPKLLLLLLLLLLLP
jgi:hypothetical protein